MTWWVELEFLDLDRWGSYKERVSQIVRKYEAKSRELRRVPRRGELVMKKRHRARTVMEVLGGLLLGLALLTTTLAYTPTLAQLRDYNPQGLEATTLEEVLALPDDEIDLATAIMILYKEWDPSFDATGSLEEIERMAVELKVQISSEDNPEIIVSLINQYLFEESGYSSSRLNPADPDYMKALENSALPSVIENKKGNCLGVSLLYLALAERLALPFYGVTAPRHVFVRYDDGRKRINVETTGKGKGYEDSFYEKEFMLHSTYRGYNFYLKNLFKREVIGVFLNNLGGTYGTKGVHDKAIAELRRSIEINPNDPEAHYNLGVVYQEKGMPDEAIAELKRAIETNPHYARAYNNLGVIYGTKGMPDEEIAEYKKAIEIDSNLAEAHTNLGAAYVEKGMYNEGITEHRRALEIDPNNAKAHYNLGVAYGEKATMFDEAIVEYKRALVISPTFTKAHNNLGLVYDHKGMYDEAIAEFKSALAIDPNDAVAHNNLGTAYVEKGMHDEAITEFKSALEIDPNYFSAHYNLGSVYDEMGMLDEAITQYKRALVINPDYAKAHYNLGLAYYEKGMHNEEIAEYKKAIEINPNYFDPHYNLGIAYHGKGMYDEAIAEFEKAIEIYPDSTEAHYNLAVIYYLEGEYDLAIEHCDTVIRLGYRVHPEFLEALEPYREK